MGNQINHFEKFGVVWIPTVSQMNVAFSVPELTLATSNDVFNKSCGGIEYIFNNSDAQKAK